jgi:hypothetical protein
MFQLEEKIEIHVTRTAQGKNSRVPNNYITLLAQYDSMKISNTRRDRVNQ